MGQVIRFPAWARTATPMMVYLDCPTCGRISLMLVEPAVARRPMPCPACAADARDDGVLGLEWHMWRPVPTGEEGGA